MSNKISTPSPDSMASSKVLKKVRDLRGGVEAMRMAGEKYLPKEARETPEDYQARLSRSHLLPALNMAIEAVVDKVFSEPVQLGQDADDAIREIAENVDGQGENITSFAKDVFADAVEAGVSFIYVDSPSHDGTYSDRQAAEMNIRPYFVHLKAENIIGWVTEVVGSQTNLISLRVQRTIQEIGKDGFSVEEIQQIRHMQIIDGRLIIEEYREGEGAEWVAYGEPIFTGLDFIPIVPIYTNRKKFMVGSPRYSALADLNIAHWQIKSGLSHIGHLITSPFLFFQGFIPETEQQASANKAIATELGPSDSAVSWVTCSPQQIQVQSAEAEKLEKQMAAMGADLMIRTDNTSGATGAAIDSARINSPLSAMSMALQDGLQTAFGFMAEYLGVDDTTTVTTKTDFTVQEVNAAILNFLLKLAQMGMLSHKTYLQTLLNFGIVKDIVPEEEIAAILQQEDDVEQLPSLELVGDDEPDVAEIVVGAFNNA